MPITKINQIAVPDGSGTLTYYDIDLPVDATPSISTLTLAQSLTLTNGKITYNSTTFALPTVSESVATLLTNVTIPTYAAGGGLSASTSGSVTTFSHLNSAITSKTTNGIYPIAFDDYGHITSYGSIIKLNNSTKFTDFYAPSALGTAGQLLVAPASGSIPTWIDISNVLSINADKGLSITISNNKTTIGHANTAITSQSVQGLYAITFDDYGHITGYDTSSITSLKNPKNITFTFNGSSIIYDGSESKAITFYAPSTLGTDGQVLIAPSTGSAPVWKTLPAVITYSAGTGLSASQSSTITTFNHINSITSLSSATLGKITYDSTGHITSFTEVSALKNPKTLTFSFNGSATYLQYDGSEAKTFTLYGVSASGTSGRIIVANSSGIPVWGNTSNFTVTLNGTATSYSGISEKSVAFYAPTTSGTSGYLLVANSSGIPTWASLTLPKITLNGTEVTSATFYAPTTYGTAGQYLIAQGSTSAPIWSTLTTYNAAGGISASTSNNVTTFKHANASISAQTTQGIYPIKIDTYGHITTYGDVVTSLKNPSALEITLNGTKTTYDGSAKATMTFYAATAAGTSGQVLTYPSSGSVPIWSALPAVMTYAAGTGLSASTSGNTTTFNHINSITAMSDLKLGQIKYDATGHITAFSEVTSLKNPAAFTVSFNGSASYVVYDGSSAKTFTLYAPTTGGTAGYFLVATSTNSAPSWKQVFSYNSVTHTLNITTS